MVCTGLQLVNFLQDVPRDLELGRVYLPAEDRRRFERDGARPAERAAPAAARVRGASARGRCSRRASRSARGSAAAIGRGVALFARGGLAALEALERAGWDVFSGRPKPSRARLAREAVARARPMSAGAAYAEVHRDDAAEAKNFAYGIMVLPATKRRAIEAIYAFAREVDDVADGDAARRPRSARGSTELATTRSTASPARTAPPAIALADARRRYPIPVDALHALVDGGLQDLDQQRYEDFDELVGYCRKVAGAVGLACLPVYGADRRRSAPSRSASRSS